MRQFELNLEGAEKQTVFADAIRVVDGSLELQRHNGDMLLDLDSSDDGNVWRSEYLRPLVWE